MPLKQLALYLGVNWYSTDWEWVLNTPYTRITSQPNPAMGDWGGGGLVPRPVSYKDTIGIEPAGIRYNLPLDSPEG